MADGGGVELSKPAVGFLRNPDPPLKGGIGLELRLSRSTLATLVALTAIVVCISGYAAHLNGGSLDFGGTEAKIVVSGSMDGEPRDYDIRTIPTGSLILIRDVPSDSDQFYSSLKVGDVLTFDYEHPVSHEKMVVTHRIVGISESGGVYTYTLKGDSIADDPTNGSEQVVTSDSGDVIGKVVGVSHWLGVLAVFVSTWTGRLCLILIPCIVLIASEVRNIVRILRGGSEGAEQADPGEAAAEAAPASEDSSPSGPVFMRHSGGERYGG